MWVCRDARFVRPSHSKCMHIYVALRADARAVRPYMHSSRSPRQPFYALIWPMWVCRDARSVRPSHSKCVHIYVVFRADARAVRPYIPWTWSNPTPFATQSRLYGCVKRFVLSHKPDFWSTFPWLMFFKKEIKKADKKKLVGVATCVQ